MKRLTLLFCMAVAQGAIAETHEISRAELQDKIHAFWIGQLAGNYMGFPFESVYIDEPIPFDVDRYYTFEDDSELPVHRGDLRGYVPIFTAWIDGAFSDDDTDIEFTTLHAVEKYGLDITYPEITEVWKTHINRNIWVANRSARTLMDEGMLAPDTGKKENNRNWYQIDPQLVNEIWSAFYPGMVDKAVERAEWGARITNDDWGVHPTMAYAAMLSAAFFEDDVEKLVDIAIEATPNEGPFAEGIRDVVRWHKEHDDWRVTRKLMHDKYYRYSKDGYEAPVSVVSSLINGLAGVLAVLYGEGDFVKTVGIATSAGYDCDNQAATCGGLIGIMAGTEGIPDEFTRTFAKHRKWREPFNNRYVNITRDGLPVATPITEIAERITNIAEQAILENGGEKLERDGEVIFRIVN